MGPSDNSKTYLIGVKDERGTFKEPRNVTFNEENMINKNSLRAGKTRIEQEADVKPLAFLSELVRDNVMLKATE